MSEEEKKAIENDILFQIDMELYDEFNDKFCKMNEWLGEIYSCQDLKDLEESKNKTEINLLRQAVQNQQQELRLKDRVIDEMAEMLVKVPDNADNPTTAVAIAMINRNLEMKKEQVKKYIINKVKGE